MKELKAFFTKTPTGGIFLALILVCALFSSMTSRFLTPTNISALMELLSS